MSAPVVHANLALHAFDRLLSEFVVQTPDVLDAVAVSAEGRLVTSRRTLDLVRADQWATYSAALLTLARGAARLCDGGAVHRIFVDLTDGYLLISPMSARWALVVYAADTADLSGLARAVAGFADDAGRILRRRLLDSRAAATGYRSP